MTTSASPADPQATPAAQADVVPTVSAPSGDSDPRPRNTRLGALLVALGSLSSFALMCIDKQLTAGPLLGAVAISLAALGVLELCGLLRALPSDEVVLPRLFGAKAGEPAYLAPRITVPVALVIVLLGRLALGPGALFVPLVLAHVVLLLSAIRRPALFVFAVSSLLLLPMLGQYGLWDPWETHYGEVAREILARDDWVTLWWAQDEWFRSKPVFIFWIEALAWGALAIPFGPDTNPGHPEWALRLPHYLLSMGALMSAYALMARVFGRRAGIISTLVLATTPYFFFLSHQAITDMPFVATMTTAMALFGLAVEADPDAPLKSYRIGRFAVSWKGLLLAGFVLAALPQALYLITRNLTFVTADLGFFAHKDEFLFGSAGNSAIPGNPVHRLRGPYLKALYYQPFAQGLLWLAGLAYLIRAIKRQRDAGTLAMFGFYLFCSFAWMAKGIPGFALPGLIAALYLFATRRWILLTSGRLRVGLGVLTIAVTGLPWYVAMYGRLGPFFTDRLLIHDHINRLASGVHGDTGSIQYFLQQLGYGMFPWFGLAPVGLVAYRLLKPASDDAQGTAGRERRTAILLALWMTASFALFNAMMTKFHHYIFPAVPPLSLLIGLALERVMGDSTADIRKERWAIALSWLAPVPLVIGIAGLYGNVRGVIPEGVATAQNATWMAENGLPTAVSALLVSVGAALLYFALQLLGAFQDKSLRAAPANASVGAALLASAFLTAFAARDLAWVTHGKPAGQERLIDLFVYNYERPFPEYLDYHPALTGFAVAAFVLIVVASVARLRKVGIYALLGVSFWFAIWGLDVHMVDLSPHWGQRELIKRYYEERHDNKEPLIAWQMNWKGENLYTGNRAHVYVDLDNKAVEKWMTEHSGSQAFFVLEHSRLGNFKRMLGKRRVEELSTLRENNKFLLVRTYL
ncbi:MAG: Polymyxin resistance protein ArnT, undecaprenyl phosphate-alpha-L-Ara4N transferase [Myxococcaceae bacterium]|nr:Polymyxin resistance protein ArnT, undecaprenyl phosphate-alpha-L-Ara4N transferase [Myxococcaceae bacterium]